MPTYKVQIEVEVEVRNFRGEDAPLPSIETVMSSWKAATAGELLGYKTLAEFGYVDCAVEADMKAWKEG